MDGQLGSQHGTNLGPLHLGDSYAAWSFVGPQAVGPGPADTWVVSLEPIPYGGIPSSVLVQGRGARPCLSVMCLALLIPTRGLTSSE